MLISVKLLTKYIIIIYALGLAHEKFCVWIEAIPKAKFSAEPFQIETAFLIDSDTKLFMYFNNSMY